MFSVFFLCNVTLELIRCLWAVPIKFRSGNAIVYVHLFIFSFAFLFNANMKIREGSSQNKHPPSSGWSSGKIFIAKKTWREPVFPLISLLLFRPSTIPSLPLFSTLFSHCFRTIYPPPLPTICISFFPSLQYWRPSCVLPFQPPCSPFLPTCLFFWPKSYLFPLKITMNELFFNIIVAV